MKHITVEQRYQIEAYLKIGKSVDFISEELAFHRSTIYREIERNKSKRGGYAGKSAQEFATDRKDRFVSFRTFTPSCEIKVLEWLKKGWSPDQISGYCKMNNLPMVSPERIYQYIRKDKVNEGNLYTFLRHKLKNRKRAVGKHYPVANRTSIEDRPEIVENKSRFGDWEMDTIIGANQKGAILTLTERLTNFIFIAKLPFGKNAKELSKVLIHKLLPYKKHVLTITTDNGAEFANHLEITEKINAIVYFAHAYCSWEKGAIENANKLIRQYVKKEDDLNNYSQAQLTIIQHNINSRPRKKHKYQTPTNLFYNFILGNVAFDS